MGKLAITGGKPVRTEPFIKWPVWDEREIKALTEVVRSGKWNRWEGDKVRRFEEEFAAYIGARYVLAVSSGTGALEAAAATIGLGPGDEVILPAYAFTAPVSAVLRAGAIPVFVDIDPETYNIDPEQIEGAITERTKAILPLHLAGLPADMDSIMTVAQRHELAVIEDAAPATGSMWRDKLVGAIGDVGMFSCQAEKNLNCGEGGILVTNDEDIWRRALSYHDYWKGQLLEQTGWDMLGSGFRMSEFQGAILLAQLERLDEQCEIRAANGLYLDQQLSRIEGISVMRTDPPVTRNSHSLYIFRYDPQSFAGLSRERFVDALQAEGIPCMTGYPRPVYKNPLFMEPNRWLKGGFPLAGGFYGREIDYNTISCPVAETACSQEAVWLPQQTLLCGHEDIHDIVHAIVKVRDNVEESL